MPIKIRSRVPRGCAFTSAVFNFIISDFLFSGQPYHRSHSQSKYISSGNFVSTPLLDVKSALGQAVSNRLTIIKYRMRREKLGRSVLCVSACMSVYQVQSSLELMP